MYAGKVHGLRGKDDIVDVVQLHGDALERENGRREGVEHPAAGRRQSHLHARTDEPNRLHRLDHRCPAGLNIASDLMRSGFCVHSLIVG